MRVSVWAQDIRAVVVGLGGKGRPRPARLLATMLVVAGVIAGTLGVPAPTAAALGGYTAVGRPGLNARTGPGTGYTVAGSIAYGAALDIDCQVTTGTNVSGSTVWDRLNAPYAGRWVSDFWVGGTPYARRDLRLPDCNAVAVTTARVVTPVAAPNGHEAAAVNWALSQLASTAYSGWCDRFVANAYGRPASGYATASDHFRDLDARGLVHRDAAPPSGALVFYGPQPGFGTAGHVVISRGGGQFISPSSTVFTYTGINLFPNYLGWAYANPDWPGRI